MVAYALAPRRGDPLRQERLNVNQLTYALMDAVEGNEQLRGLGRLTVYEYIKKGLDL